MNRGLDRFEFCTGQEEEYLRQVQTMEEESIWLNGIRTRGIRMSPLDLPLFSDHEVMWNWDDGELVEDTMTTGTKLLLTTDFDTAPKKYLVRDTARSTILTAAGISGAALNRMEPLTLAQTLNHAFSVAAGTSQILIRCGKVSAVHSDAEGGYAVMPVPELLSVVREEVTARLGRMVFREGYLSHGFTRCIWELPDIHDRVLTEYQDAVENGCSLSAEIIPAVIFSSSDTSDSSVYLTPAFRVEERPGYCRLVDGVQVRHTRKGMVGKDPLAYFRQECEGIYAAFDLSMDKVREMSSSVVRHPINFMTGVCKRLKVPRKHAAAAMETAEIYIQSGQQVTQLDLYLAMTQMVNAARQHQLPMATIIHLEELTSKFLKLDLEEYDLPGTVTW